MYLGAVALIWAYSNHEISYALIAIFVSYLGAIVIWRLSRRLTAVIAGGLAVMAVTAVALPRLAGWPPLPPIPWERPTWDAIFGYIGGVLSNPRSIALLVEGLVILVAAVMIIRQLIRERRAAATSSGDKTRRSWFDVLLGAYEPGSVPHAIYTLAKDPRTFWIGAAIFTAIFVLLYTTLFSNMQGILSGLFGAIGYWLGQHDVRRGEQPWFYYLSLLPQYELLAVTFGGVMTVLTIVRGVRYWLGRQAGSLRLFTQGFLVYWAIPMFVILSWAGEKMPWLITHAALPFIVLAGALLGEIVERLMAGHARLNAGGLAWGSRYRTALTALYAAAMLLIAGLFVVGAAEASRAEPAQPLPVLPAVAAMALVSVGYGLLVGYRRAGLVASLTLAGLLALMQVRIGWLVSFENGDVPKEQLVYVQSSPDVTRVMAEIERLSEEISGGKTMNIMYDGGEHGVAWPFEWYLRDFKNKRFMPEGPTSDPGPDWPVLLVGAGYRSKVDPILTEYEGIEYVLRWHYPEEETYRGIAIAPELRPGRSAWKTPEQPHGPLDVAASLWHSVALQRDPAEQARLWRYFMYREPYAPLGSFNFMLYVRKEALRYYNALRY